MAKIKTITVSNLKAVSSLTADFNGCTAIITGANNKGKSTFLRGLIDRIQGHKPEIVVKHGESEGYAQLELTTGEKFVWTFNNTTKTGEKLTFITERDIKKPLTKEISTHYFPETFDVDKFLNDPPAKQRKTLQKLTGIDFTEFDKQYEEAVEERKYRNKVLAEEKAKAGYVDPTLPKQPIPVEDLEKELNQVAIHNMNYANIVKGMKGKEQTVAHHKARIAELEAMIAAENEKIAAQQELIEKGKVWMEQDKNKPKTNTEELEEKIRKAKEINEQVRLNLEAVEQDKKIEKAQQFADDADKEVKRLLEEKDEVIRNASMPDGFGFSDEGITYKGLPFTREQLSSSGIYIAALKLAAITLGEVKTLHFDASFLDKNSLESIEEWATENDLQLLIERPDWEGGEITYEIIAK